VAVAVAEKLELPETLDDLDILDETLALLEAAGEGLLVDVKALEDDASGLLDKVKVERGELLS
jgi:hypothetical protein